jgi:hypothetical protein
VKHLIVLIKEVEDYQILIAQLLHLVVVYLMVVLQLWVDKVLLLIIIATTLKINQSIDFLMMDRWVSCVISS